MYIIILYTLRTRFRFYAKWSQYFSITIKATNIYYNVTKVLEMKGEEKAMLEGDETRKVKFDEILEDLGDFGKYQKLAYFLLFLPTIFSAMQKQSW